MSPINLQVFSDEGFVASDSSVAVQDDDKSTLIVAIDASK